MMRFPWLSVPAVVACLLASVFTMTSVAAEEIGFKAFDDPIPVPQDTLLTPIDPSLGADLRGEAFEDFNPEFVAAFSLATHLACRTNGWCTLGVIGGSYAWARREAIVAYYRNTSNPIYGVGRSTPCAYVNGRWIYCQ